MGKSTNATRPVPQPTGPSPAQNPPKPTAPKPLDAETLSELLTEFGRSQKAEIAEMIDTRVNTAIANFKAQSAPSVLPLTSAANVGILDPKAIREWAVKPISEGGGGRNNVSPTNLPQSLKDEYMRAMGFHVPATAPSTAQTPPAEIPSMFATFADVATGSVKATSVHETLAKSLTVQQLGKLRKFAEANRTLKLNPRGIGFAVAAHLYQEWDRLGRPEHVLAALDSKVAFNIRRMAERGFEPIGMIPANVKDVATALAKVEASGRNLDKFVASL